MRAEICGTKNHREKDPSLERSRAKNSEESLVSPHVLLVFAWYEGLHYIGPEVVVQLINMEKGFVWLQTIACLSKACSEFHSVALVPVAMVSYDRFYHKFLFVVMSDLQRYCPRWVIVERPQIVDMGSCPLAIDEV